MAKFFTKDELAAWAREGNVQQLFEAACLQVDQLQQRSSQLKEARAEIAKLKKLLEEAQTAPKRQAAPFRLPEARRNATPKRPGRKAGHPGSCRPRPEHIDEDVCVELQACEGCGQCDWIDQTELEQFIEELPVTRPRVTRLRTYEATCSCCGKKSASTHPLQVSRAGGAAAVQLGPRALAVAVDLNKAKGLTMRKTCAVLNDHFSLKLTPGGLSQAIERVAHKVAPQYQKVQQELLTVPALHVDETSWWVCGTLWWLWVFTHPKGTFYVIRKSRGREVFEEIIGAVFGGVLVTDCLSVYDLESGLQQKCYAHHLKAIHKASEVHPEKGAGFLSEVKTVLQSALTLGKEKDQCPPQEFVARRDKLKAAAKTLLATPRDDTSEESVRNRLSKQEDHLFTFLEHAGVDATNNLAERQLRPAVIARKISCGNKTETGAHSFEILASIAATCVQLKNNFIDLIAKAVPFSSA